MPNKEYSPIELAGEDFRKTIASGVALVNFYTDGSDPCGTMSPIVDTLAATYEGKANVCKVNVDKETKLREEYAVGVVPCLVVFKDGHECVRFVGVTAESKLSAAVDAALRLSAGEQAVSRDDPGAARPFWKSDAFPVLVGGIVGAAIYVSTQNFTAGFAVGVVLALILHAAGEA